MPAPYYSPIPKTTPYEYIGEPPALGSLSLTKLARSYAELDTSDLSDLFPDQHNPERTIVIETMQETLDLMPLARPGVPVGSFLKNDRMYRRIVEPALFRQDDFIDQYLINQLRAPGTMNDLNPPQRIIEERVRKMVSNHNRTLDFFRIQVLLGGIDYECPYSGVKINVSTQIPQHNFFSYKGMPAPGVAAGDPTTLLGTTYEALAAMGNPADPTHVVKDREDALLFTSIDEKYGVPWTHPNADIIRSIRYIKHMLKNANKNVFTDIYMSGDLYSVIQENQDVKARDGGMGYINHEKIGSAGLEPASASNPNAASNLITYGPGGDIAAIAGVNIHTIDQIYTDPRDKTVKNMWPSHKVVLLARNHINDPGQTLGYTQYCVGESPDQTSGLWMRSGPEQAPPNTPGRSMQMGNSFLPYAMYPQWIAILDVCEPGDIDSRLNFRRYLDYGTF